MQRILFFVSCFSLLLLASLTYAQNEEATEQAQQAAEDWLPLVDEDDYGGSWEQASPLFQQLTTEENWAKNMQDLRDKVGGVESRELQNSQYTTTLENAPAGEYVVIVYTSTFEKLENTIETVVMRKTEDDGWGAIGYFVQPAQ